jgi:hypothetical protein
MDYTVPMDPRAAEAHGLDGTSAVVDLGAGSGQFALAAARRFGLPDFWKAVALDRIACIMRPGGVLWLQVDGPFYLFLLNARNFRKRPRIGPSSLS